MKADKITIIRTVILFISLINIVLKMFDINVIPIDNELISQAVSVGILIYSAISSWWHNNSFTKEAIKADQVLTQLKKGE